MRAEMTTEQRELIEEFGLLQEQMGGTRMTGRVSGWLLLADPPVQSLTEIAEGLGVSKAAVSGAARLLLQTRVHRARRRARAARRLLPRAARRPRRDPAPSTTSAPCTGSSTRGLQTVAGPRPVTVQLRAHARSPASSPRSSRPRCPNCSPLARAPHRRGAVRRRRGRRHLPTAHWRHPLSWLTKIALRNRSIVGLAVLAVLRVRRLRHHRPQAGAHPRPHVPVPHRVHRRPGLVAQGRGADHHHAAGAGGQGHQRRQGVRLVLERRREHHHHRVRVRHGHAGEGGRGPAGDLRRAGDAAGDRPGAGGRGPQLQQHAGRAAGGVVRPAGRSSWPRSSARAWCPACRASTACRRSRSPACSRCSWRSGSTRRRSPRSASTPRRSPRRSPRPT